MKHWIPNTLTLLNLLSGSIAIYFLFNDQTRWTLICAALCLVFDMLDGFLARRLGVSSDLGVQLDSLADLVSFGLLPGFIFTLMYGEYCDSAVWVSLIAMLYTGAAAARLAKFNIDKRDQLVFYGLPTPAAAVFGFGVLLMQYLDHSWMSEMQCNHGLFVLLIVLLSSLMLSNLRLWSLKGLGKPRGPYILGAFGLVTVGLALWIGVAFIPVMVVLYVLFGLFNQLIKAY